MAPRQAKRKVDGIQEHHASSNDVCLRDRVAPKFASKDGALSELHPLGVKLWSLATAQKRLQA